MLNIFQGFHTLPNLAVARLCIFANVQQEILKSLHRLKLSDSDLSTGLSYPAFEQLGPDDYGDRTRGKGSLPCIVGYNLD